MTKTKIASAADDGLVAGSSRFSGVGDRCLVAALAVLMIAQVASAQPAPTEAQRQAIREQIERDIAAERKAHPEVPLDAASSARAALGRRAVRALAASDPCANRTDGLCGTPRWTVPTLSLAGSFRVPGNDSQGNFINYGGQAVAVSQDGKFLYAACWVNATNSAPMKGTFAKFEIPALGGVARLVHDCQGLSQSDLVKMSGDPGAYFPMISGLLEQDGRLAVAGMITYDAANITTRNLWSGTSPTTLAGPFRGANGALAETDPAQPKPGMSRHTMAAIPPALRQYFGGATAIVTTGTSSIVARASYGQAAFAFNPADVTRDRFPMTMILGCPHAVASCITYGTPQSLWVYNGSEQNGGAFFIPGTRTLLVPEREALGPTCYGYATRNQAEHGKPYLDAVKCYSLSDPLDQKGPMGYPYQLVAKLYDVAQMAEVFAGRAKPWDVQPYAVFELPGSSPSFQFGYHGTGVMNTVRGEYYLTGELYPDGQGTATIKVLRGFPADGSAPPPPPPPAPTGSLAASVTTCEAPCSTTLTWTSANGAPDMDGATIAASGSRQIAYTVPGAFTYTLTVTGPAGTTPYRQSVTVTVTAQPPPPPPPPPPSCRITTEVTRAPDGSLVLGATTLVCQ